MEKVIVDAQFTKHEEFDPDISDFSFEITKVKEMHRLFRAMQKKQDHYHMIVLPETRVNFLSVNEYFEDTHICKYIMLAIESAGHFRETPLEFLAALINNPFFR
jgi:hypothetical protein